MGDFLITIITKDSHTKLKRILISLSKNISLRNMDILVVDDSCLSHEIEKNIRDIQGMKAMNITYVNRMSRDLIKECILAKLPKSQKDFLKKIVLGSNEWNTHNVRNVGQIVAKTVFRDKKYVIGMDDDMIIEKDFSLDYSGIIKKKNILLGVRLKGCPDLSRIEWIKAYNRYMLHKKGEEMLKDKKDYINVLIEDFGIKKVGKKIAAYTDLKVRENKDDKENDVMPLRECIHGGCYISDIKNLDEFPFPSFYNEDRYRFDQIKEKNKIKFNFVDQSIIHGASAKSILLKDKIFFEEEGEILKRYYNNGNSKKSFSLFVNKKIAYLKHEIVVANKLIEIYGKNAGIFRKIILLLQETVDLYMSFLKSERLLKKIEKFNVHKKERVTFAGYLKNMNIPEEILSKIDYTIKKIIISPHIDDALLGMGGYIMNRQNKNSVMIYDVCTLSTYTKDGMKDKKRVSSMRRKEEEKIGKLLDIKLKDLGFEDAIVRVGSSEKKYIDANYKADKDVILYKIYDKIKKMSGIYKKSILCFPLSIGDHIDHKLIFEIGKRLYYEGYNVIFYEDIGYDQNIDKRYMNNFMKKTGMILMPLLYAFKNIQQKIDICKMYESQMDDDIIENIKKVHRDRGGEKMWIPKSLYNSLSSMI